MSEYNMTLAEQIVAGGGSGSDDIWLPSVDAAGDLSWRKSSTDTPPETVNIKGAPGADGQDGAPGQDGADGLGIKGVTVNASNHLVVTYDDDTTEDAGAIDVTVPINDTTPASNKVYSSSKVETGLATKFNANEFTISGGGANLVNFTQSKYNWKPSTTSGATYSDGSERTNCFTTNLWSYTPGEKIKFTIETMPSYFRFFYYDSSKNYLGGGADATLDTDGAYYIYNNDGRIAYMCFIFDYTTSSNFETLVAGRYSEFGSRKVVVNDLYLSDDNVAMAKGRLGLVDNILYGKKWAVAGDSFTAGDFTGVTTPTIPSGKYAGQKAVYPYLIATRCNMTIQDLAKAGRTLALPSGETSSYNSFVNHYQSVAEDADYLTIYFGINDSHQSATIPLGTISDNTTDTFYGAWNVILTWLITNRPNLKIGIIVSNGCDSDDYRTATIAIANKYGIPYIDMNGDSRTPCMIRSTNASIDNSIRSQRTSAWRVSQTNAHPNAACHEYESTFIENFLRTL